MSTQRCTIHVLLNINLIGVVGGSCDSVPESGKQVETPPSPIETATKTGSSGAVTEELCKYRRTFSRVFWISEHACLLTDEIVSPSEVYTICTLLLLHCASKFHYY